MPFKTKKMFLISFCVSGIARIAIHCLSYKRLSAYFGNSSQMLVASVLVSNEQIQKALAIQRTIRLVSRHTPWHANCLTQALVAKFWCQRAQIPYLLFIGLAKKRKEPLERDAHAWITVGPVIISGGESLSTHHVICSYSNAF